jgi:SAM-dependent methyltransferase
MKSDRDAARDYFDRLAPEYDRAFAGEGSGLLAAGVNRFFRGPTFARRMRALESLFREIGLSGRAVLDLGCGSGQVSLLAASLGARVRGIDIAPGMLDIAREAARRAGLADRVRFEEGDAAGEGPLPPADLTLLVGVLEYYEDFAPLLRRAAAVTRERLVVAHTTRVWYRMILRRLLFRGAGARVYFHRQRDVIAAAQAAGLRLEQERSEQAFHLLLFRRA